MGLKDVIRRMTGKDGEDDPKEGEKKASPRRDADQATVMVQSPIAGTGRNPADTTDKIMATPPAAPSADTGAATVAVQIPDFDESDSARRTTNDATVMMQIPIAEPEAAPPVAAESATDVAATVVAGARLEELDAEQFI